MVALYQSRKVLTCRATFTHGGVVGPRPNLQVPESVGWAVAQHRRANKSKLSGSGITPGDP